MLGFDALSAQPFSTSDQADELYVESGYWEYDYAEGDVQPTNVDATASAAGVTVTFSAPTATACIAVTASASGVTLTLSDPAATATGGATIAVDGQKARQTFPVTVSNDGYGNKYYIDGVKQDSLSLHEV